jgi:hypothetical protein
LTIWPAPYSPSDGHLVYWDTDGAVVAASPDGGEATLRDGRHIRELSWAELDTVLATFDSLAPLDDGTPFWKVRRGERRRPWWGVFVASKRWVFFTINADRSIHIADASEHGLAGTLMGPPGMDNWSGDVAEQLVTSFTAPEGELARQFSWEADHAEFAALRRRSVTRPEDLANLPASFGLAPFATYLEANSPIPGQPGPVAPDWGPDTDWRELPWSERSGHPVPVSTDPEDPTAMTLETLTTKAATWAGHELLNPEAAIVTPEPVHIHPALVRYVGRSGGKYRGDPSQLIYQDVDIARLLDEATDALGVSTVAALTGISERSLRGLSHGRHPRSSTLARAVETLQAAFPDAADPLTALAERVRAGRRCRSCGRGLVGHQRLWCSNTCRMSVTRRRSRRDARKQE